MTEVRLGLRALARADNEAAIDHYLAEAGEAVALRFIDALEDAFGAIDAHPAAGSPRYAHELDLPGLRTWQVSGFPYLVFYMETAGQADV